jgi:hypothetical protein
MSSFTDMAIMRNFEAVCERCEVYRLYVYVMMMMTNHNNNNNNNNNRRAEL